jgi:hypothetical protein
VVKNFCIALCLTLFILSVVSCTRNSGERFENNSAPSPVPAPVQVAVVETRPSARALAILQTGAQPLWFQLTEEGPVHLRVIEDAVLSAALVPWTVALHVRFFQERGDELVMAVNRDGFLKLAPNSGATPGLAMYRFSGGIWRQYTLGGFVYYDEKPAALLYIDDRFLDVDAPFPNPRTWSFNMESNSLFPIDIPALQFFPAEEGWDVDTLRLGGDGFWYYRAARRSGPNPEIRILRTADLSQEGESTSLDLFYNSAAHVEEINHPALPPLPEGFFYTGIGRAGDSLFASWEEQENFFIGAAGFVVLKP